MSKDTIDVETVGATQALARVEGGKVGAALKPEEIQTKPPVTAAQAKVEAIANLTMSAYARAATLELTKGESDRLQEDFPDEAFKPGAAGKEHLIYIEHAFLRDRFTAVFGMGKWAMVPRNRWAEPFKTQKGVEGSRVYVEAMLIVRGCFVSEAVGEMEYYPSNASQNYGDAVEGAESAAFRRCAKKFGVGLQAWKKDWCDGWWARRRGGRDFSKGTPRAQNWQNAENQASAPEKTHQNAPGRAETPRAGMDGGGKPASASQPAKPAAQAPTGTSTPAKKPAEQRYATIETLKWLIGELKDCKELAIEYFRKLDKPAVLLPTEGLDSLPLWAVPITHQQLALLKAAIADFGNGDEAKHAYAPNPRPEPPKEKAPAKAPTKTAPAKPAEKKRDPEWWRDIIFLIPPAGVRRDDYLKSPNTIGQLYEGRHDPEVAKRLFGMIAHFEVKKTWTGQDGQERPRRPEQIEAEETFREALDACKDYADKHHRDTGEATGEPKPGPGEDVPGQRAQGEAFQGEERTPFD